MTVSSESRKAGPFAGDASTVTFAFTFKVFDNTDPYVVHTSTAGVETVKTYLTHYTVSLNADQDASPGGTITMLTAPAVGEKLTITSDVPDLQSTQLPSGGAWNAKTVERALDRNVILTQQLALRINNALRYAISDTAGSTDLPLLANRASKFLAFDASGNPIASDGSGTPTTSAWSTVLDDATIAAGMKTIRDALSDETTPAVDDELFFYDLSATEVNRITVANFLKSVNGLTAETAPAIDDVLPIYDLSAGTTDKITLANMLKVIGGLTNDTSPLLTDEYVFYDTVAGEAKKVTLNNVMKIVTLLTAETAPAVDDELLLYDLSAGTADKITLSKMLEVINNLTEDTSPDKAADFALVYDTSASTVKKVKLSNLAAQAGIEHLNSGSGSGAASFVVDMSAYTTYAHKRLIVSGHTPSGGTARLTIRTSATGSSSFAASGGDYEWITEIKSPGSYATEGSGDDKIYLTDSAGGGLNGNSDRGWRYVIDFLDCENASIRGNWLVRGGYYGSAGTYFSVGGAHSRTATGRIRGIEFTTNAGTLTYAWTLKGYN